MISNEYFASVVLTKSPLTSIVVRYVQTPDMKNHGFFVKDMIHNVAVGEGTISTNMTHMIMDVMTTGYFAPLRVQIEHEVEKARRARIAAEE